MTEYVEKVLFILWELISHEITIASDPPHEFWLLKGVWNHEFCLDHSQDDSLFIRGLRFQHYHLGSSIKKKILFSNQNSIIWNENEHQLHTIFVFAYKRVPPLNKNFFKNISKKIIDLNLRWIQFVFLNIVFFFFSYAKEILQIRQRRTKDSHENCPLNLGFPATNTRVIRYITETHDSRSVRNNNCSLNYLNSL